MGSSVLSQKPLLASCADLYDVNTGAFALLKTAFGFDYGLDSSSNLKNHPLANLG